MKKLFLLLESLFFIPWAVSAENPLAANPDNLGDEEMTTVAAGYEQPLIRAPAIVSVITASDIEKTGATTVAEILETIPGLNYSTARGVNDLFIIRGLYDEFNTHTLVMINGIAVTNVVNGGRPQAWKMPVHNIARIEVIRGPGSALYGADATAGVINIVTKTAKDIQGFQGGISGGSFDSYGLWAQWGGKIGEWEGAFSLETSTTEGYQKTLHSDAQTAADILLKTHASLAPGPINTQRDDLNARLDLKGENWRFRAGYQGFLNVGTGAGILLALDPNGSFDTTLTTADFTYDLPKTGSWDLATQWSYQKTTTDAHLYPFPAGSFRGLFRTSLRDDFHFQTDEIRGGLTALYGRLPHHRLRVGAGFSYTRLSDVEESRNFLLNSSGVPIPTAFSDVSALGQDPVLIEHSRMLWFGFAQDEWWLTSDWILTGGVRVDHYSDVGTTVNPRLALTWSLSPTSTAKLIYGRAFRAPNFTELYGSNTLAVIGNRNLDPETINMVDLSISQQWAPKAKVAATLFGYDLNNVIGRSLDTNDRNPLAKTQKENLPGYRAYGVELEGSYPLLDRVTLHGSYANTSLVNATGQNLSRNSPQHQVMLGLDWQINDRWNFNTQWRWISDREIILAQKTLGLEGYTWGTAALRYDDPKRWFLTLRANNLLNEEAYEATNFLLIPSGIPLPGRNITAQIGFHLP